LHIAAHIPSGSISGFKLINLRITFVENIGDIQT
jgi:hypothetical protein